METSGWWDFKSWVLSCGSGAKVFEPEAFKQEIVGELRTAGSLYRHGLCCKDIGFFQNHNIWGCCSFGLFSPQVMLSCNIRLLQLICLPISLTIS